ncbi:uncharacterized protein LTR77_001959 [Saxophila tyrrhenica]|uniref:Uncharacterized protein n=1 Tax=Saxophila tyrrhenica TaxID=1690608 RepID=A0AAV9PKS3_9PEZI|nr:hypothetical protein LTR77_001959 [Saxophila tyrrhenica]
MPRTINTHIPPPRDGRKPTVNLPARAVSIYRKERRLRKAERSMKARETAAGPAANNRALTIRGHDAALQAIEARERAANWRASALGHRERAMQIIEADDLEWENVEDDNEVEGEDQVREGGEADTNQQQPPTTDVAARVPVGPVDYFTAEPTRILPTAPLLTADQIQYDHHKYLHDQFGVARPKTYITTVEEEVEEKPFPTQPTAGENEGS